MKRRSSHGVAFYPLCRLVSEFDGKVTTCPQRNARNMNTMKSMIRVLLVLTVSVAGLHAQGNAPGSTAAVVAEASPHAPKSSSSPQFQDRYPRYKIGSGDSFDVNFELSPEFNQNVTVQPDGFITLRGVGDVNVAGQTVP